MRSLTRLRNLAFVLFAAALTMPAWGQAAAPVFSLPSGTYVMPQNLTLTAPGSSAINWCYVNSGPCTPGTAYSAQIYINPAAMETICANEVTGGVTSATLCQYYVTQTVATGDARTVTEPTIPTGCTVVNATKYIVATTTLSLDPFGATAGTANGGTGTQGTLGATGATSFEPSSTASPTFTSSETSDYTAVYTNALAASPSNSCVELSASGGMNGFVLPPFQMPTGVTLVVDPGVTVFASRNLSDYGGTNCGVVTTAGGGCNHWITSANTTGSGIMGYGTLDGRGWDKFSGSSVGWYYNTIQAYCNNHGGAQDGSPACTTNGSGNNEYGFNILNLVNSNSFTLYKIHLKDSPEFMVKWGGTNGSTVTSGFTAWGIKETAPFEASNTDGIDPTNNAQNVTIANSYISNGDNQVAIKSDSGSGGAPVKNVSILNTHTYSGIGLTIGSDTGGGVSNVLVNNIAQSGNLNNVESTGLGINSSTANGGSVNVVTFSNVCMRNEYNSIRVYTNYGSQTGSQTPIYNNITFQNIHVLPSTAPYATGNSGYFTFQGLSGNPITAALNNVLIDGTNQGIAQQGSVTRDQYATIVLGPGSVDSSLLSQFSAGISVTTSGSSGSSTSPDACATQAFQPIVGDLVLKSSTQNNLKAYTGTGPATYTLEAVVRPASDISIKESAALTQPITFYDNGVSVGTAAIGGNGSLASLTLTGVNPGTHVYTAAYPGDSNYSPYAFGSLTAAITGPAATPVFNPAPGPFTGVQNVTITTATTGAQIYYTTNGSTPSSSSQPYTGPIPVSASQTLNAIAIAPGFFNSAVTSGTYTINLPTAATPTFLVAPGSYATAQTVSMSSATAGALIYYTLDGSTPTTSSTLYVGTLIAVTGTETIKAIAVAPGYVTSAVGTGAYTITSSVTAAVIFQPAGGTYGGTQSVTLSSTSSGAQIFYCLTPGCTPTTSSTLYTGAIIVSGTSTTINAIAVSPGNANSLVATAAYALTIAGGAPSNYTRVYGSNVQDAGGNLMASGTITFQATDTKGIPTSVRVGGGGQIITRPTSATITNGAFSLNLADVSMSSPTYFCYSATITDNVTGSTVLGGANYSCIQPYGAVYDLDNYSYSTTPVQPPANASMNGNFSLNGNMYLTGSLYANLVNLTSYSINAATIAVTGALTAAQVNGVVNPLLYPGNDLGAQINNAFAATCSATTVEAGYTKAPVCAVKVPPGIYTVTTQIAMPSATSDAALIMDGAFLNFTGSNLYYGISTGVANDQVVIHGGYLSFLNAPNMKGGVVLSFGTQGAFIDQVREGYVTNGDGLVNFGTNVCTVTNSTFVKNLYGVHLLGSPGYASNNCKFIGNIIKQNAREGVIDGDRTQYPVGWPIGNGTQSWATAGVSSPNFNNLFIGNDLESNGTSSTSSVFYPAVLTSLTVSDTFQGNYFESTAYDEIQVGQVGPFPTDTLYQNLYSVSGPNGGNSVGTSIVNNYFTPSGGDEIALPAAISTTIRDNAESSGGTTSPCFVDVTAAALNGFVGNNNVTASSYFCQGGNPESAAVYSTMVGANHSALDFAIDGDTVFVNSAGAAGGANTNSAGSLGGTGIKFTLQGPPAPSNPQNSTTSDPFCDPTYSNGFLWEETSHGHLWMCQADTDAPGGGGAGNASDGHSTWIKVN